MSSYRSSRRPTRYAGLAACALLLSLMAGCQVRPLHADIDPAQSTGSVSLTSAMQAIAVEPSDDRISQQVGNELIFLIHGGSEQPANPVYRLRLVIDEDVRELLREPIAGRATGQSVTISGVYQLIEPETNEVIFARRAQAQANFDRFDQIFADERALRDAENRAAAVMAQRISADLALALQDGIERGADQGA